MKQVHVFHHVDYHNTLHQQIGHGIPVFTGYRQKGGGLGSILGFLGRYAIPLLKKYVLPHAKTAVFKTISDVGNGQSVKEAIKSNATAMLKNVGQSITSPQSGAGLVRKKRKAGVTLASVACCELKRKGLNHKSPNTSKKTKKSKPKSKPKSKRSKKKKVQSKRDIFG